MTSPIENKPFRINFKNKDQTIFAVRDGILCIFFRNDYGWLGVPDNMYNRTWSNIERKGIKYLTDNELHELSQKFTNGKELLTMRETMKPKFRAWDTLNNEWAKGFFVFSDGGLYTPDYGFDKKFKKTNAYPIVEQERFVLMQSTGLFDKNGVEVFVGDVVEYEGKERAVVVFERGVFKICLNTYFSAPLYKAKKENIEVLGNIYKNPDLVEMTNEI